MKDLIFRSAIAEISPVDLVNPGLRTMTFIFCDDQPNENNHAISVEDFASIKQTAIGMPLKMKFFGKAVGNHLGSIPIGYIKNIYDRKDGDTNQLVAEAHLFADEYPDEVEFLAHKFAENDAPGVSWELKYSDSIIENGIEWLKGIITKAATIVRNPAYGNRTAILALASNKEIDEDQMMEELSELISDNSPKITNEGGSNSMDEKELQTLKDRIAELETELADKQASIDDLTTKVSSLETANAEKDTTIAGFQKKETLATRVTALTEAGVTLPTETEKLAAKQEFILGLSEEAFEEYKTDLAEAIASAKKEKSASASAGPRPTLRLPKFDAAASVEDKTNIGDLRERFKGFRYAQATESE